MQALEYNVLHNKVDALNDVVKNNEETQVLLFLWYKDFIISCNTKGKI